MLILTQPGEGNSHLTGRGRRTLPVRVLIPKNFNTLKSNISFFIEALDELPTRQVKSNQNSPRKLNLILKMSIIPHTSYHPNKKSYHS